MEFNAVVQTNIYGKQLNRLEHVNVQFKVALLPIMVIVFNALVATSMLEQP